MIIGDISVMQEEQREKFHDALEKTKNNTGLTLVLALSYSSRWEIAAGVKRIAILWPDFTKKDLLEIVRRFQLRNRRYEEINDSTYSTSN